MLRGLALFSLVPLLALGCERTDPHPGPRSAATSPPAGTNTPASSVGPAPRGSASPGTPWTLRMRGIYGLCPDDGRSCDQTYEVNSDGAFQSTVLPNPFKGPNAPAAITKHAMDAKDFEKVRALVASKAFDDEMTHGFPCQGGQKDPDATWKITFITPASTRVQHGEYCISGATDAVNTPRTVLGLLRK